jgi:hypothetical protein
MGFYMLSLWAFVGWIRSGLANGHLSGFRGLVSQSLMDTSVDVKSAHYAKHTASRTS